MPQNFQNMIVWLLLFLIALWFLYLAYRIAVHVDAWPFGQ